MRKAGIREVKYRFHLKAYMSGIFCENFFIAPVSYVLKKTRRKRAYHIST